MKYSQSVIEVIVDAVLEQGGSDDDFLRLLSGEQDTVKRIAAIICERPAEQSKPPAPVEYFVPVPDGDVPAAHQPTLAKYRQLANVYGVQATTAVCYRVKAGFTLKSHAPEAGPCSHGFKYLQGWSFPDTPTVDCLVFWVPRILEGSTSQSKDQQIKSLDDVRNNFELPANHLNGFGQVGLLAGLILAHFKATEERVPLGQNWVRTDTCDADGCRLFLGRFGGAGLDRGSWCVDDSASSDLGVFACGVEALGS